MNNNRIDTGNLRKHLHQIEGKLQTISMDYERKIINTSCNDLNLLHYCLIYRNGSIGYHLDLTANHLDHYANFLKTKEGIINGPLISTSVGMKMTYLLDDLIFNLMSFYDYFATYVLYVFNGDEIRKSAKGYDPLNTRNKKSEHLRNAMKKISWMELSKLAKNNPNRKARLKYDSEPLLSSIVKNTIIHWDNTFVYKLGKLRSDIIHNEIMPVADRYTDSSLEGARFHFSVHGKFSELFPKVGDDYTEVITFLINSFTKSIHACTSDIIKDIENNRLVKKEDMFLKWKHEL